MSSYYNRIEGTLNTGQTARSSDIHLIQSGVQDAFQKALIDICGTGVILGETEDALKLEPTTQSIDQYNSFDIDNLPLPITSLSVLLGKRFFFHPKLTSTSDALPEPYCVSGCTLPPELAGGS